MDAADDKRRCVGGTSRGPKALRARLTAQAPPARRPRPSRGRRWPGRRQTAKPGSQTQRARTGGTVRGRVALAAAASRAPAMNPPRCAALSMTFQPISPRSPTKMTHCQSSRRKPRGICRSAGRLKTTRNPSSPRIPPEAPTDGTSGGSEIAGERSAERCEQEDDRDPGGLCCRFDPSSEPREGHAVEPEVNRDCRCVEEKAGQRPPPLALAHVLAPPWRRSRIARKAPACSASSHVTISAPMMTWVVLVVSCQASQC